MRHGGPGRRWLRTTMACLLLSLIATPDGLAGEWESMRESYDNKLKAHARRIAEIEARERGFPADQEKRADKITRDRISGIKGSLKTAEKAYREQGEYPDIVIGEWGTEGAERKKLRESIATLQKNLESANASLARAIEGQAQIELGHREAGLALHVVDARGDLDGGDLDREGRKGDQRGEDEPSPQPSPKGEGDSSKKK